MLYYIHSSRTSLVIFIIINILPTINTYNILTVPVILIDLGIRYLFNNKSFPVTSKLNKYLIKIKKLRVIKNYEKKRSFHKINNKQNIFGFRAFTVRGSVVNSHHAHQVFMALIKLNKLCNMLWKIYVCEQL